MGRPKEFQRDEVLQKAVQAFWQSSYEATSIQDLVDAMGIGRASLYDTFGSKQDLFLEALKMFVDGSQHGVWMPLRQDGTAMHRLQSFVDGLVDYYSNPEHSSCMVMKTTVMPQANNEHVREVLVAFNTELQALIEDFIRRAIQDGELSRTEVEAKSLALGFMNSIRGLAVTACLSTDRSELQASAQAAIDALHGHSLQPLKV